MIRAAVIALALLAASPASAIAAPLSKHKARTEGLRFVTPFVDLLDVDRTVTPIMERPGDCQRLSGGGIRCQFKAYLHSGQMIQSWVTVRRQRDGLLGFNFPLDVLGESARL